MEHLLNEYLRQEDQEYKSYDIYDYLCYKLKIDINTAFNIVRDYAEKNNKDLINYAERWLKDE